MKRAASSILAALAIAIGLPSGANAATPIKTTINLGGIGSSLQVFDGLLESPNPKCRASRTVKLFFSYPTGEKLIDTGTSSRLGAFALAGDTSGIVGGRIIVPRKNIGTRRHPRYCKATSVGLA